MVEIRNIALLSSLSSLLLLLLLFVDVGDTCSCASAHPQTYFCDADFAFRATVMSEAEKVPGQDYEVKYGVHVTQLFKGLLYKSNPRIQLYARIHTPSESNLCGTYLVKGGEYLMMGRSTDSGLQLNLCDWHQQWKDVSNATISSLTGGFDCGCGVTRCRMSGDCDPYVGEKGCRMVGEMWEVDPRVAHCLCTRGGEGNTCAWDCGDGKFAYPPEPKTPPPPEPKTPPPPEPKTPPPPEPKTPPPPEPKTPPPPEPKTRPPPEPKTPPPPEPKTPPPPEPKTPPPPEPKTPPPPEPKTPPPPEPKTPISSTEAKTKLPIVLKTQKPKEVNGPWELSSGPHPTPDDVTTMFPTYPQEMGLFDDEDVYVPTLPSGDEPSPIFEP